MSSTLTGVKYLKLFSLWILPVAILKNNNNIKILHFRYMIFLRSVIWVRNVKLFLTSEPQSGWQ